MVNFIYASYLAPPSFNHNQFDDDAIFEIIFVLWSGGIQNKNRIKNLLESIGFVVSDNNDIIYPDETYFESKSLESTINEAILGNIDAHAKSTDYLYCVRETALGMEVLTLDFGKGVIRNSNPKHDIKNIFDGGVAFEYDSRVYGWGMGHIAAKAEIVRIGSMNGGKITVVERHEKVNDGLFTRYKTTQNKYNSNDLDVNISGTGFFYHFFFRKNPWSPMNIRFTDRHPRSVFGIIEETLTPSIIRTAPVFNLRVNDVVTINYRETDWTYYTGIYYGTLIDFIDTSEPDKPFSIELTRDASNDNDAPDIPIGGVIEVHRDKLENISTARGVVYSIKDKYDYQRIIRQLALTPGAEIRVVIKKPARQFSQKGIVREIPCYSNGFFIRLDGVKINPMRVNTIKRHNELDNRVKPYVDESL